MPTSNLKTLALNEDAFEWKAGTRLQCTQTTEAPCLFRRMVIVHRKTGNAYAGNVIADIWEGFVVFLWPKAAVTRRLSLQTEIELYEIEEISEVSDEELHRALALEKTAREEGYKLARRLDAIDTRKRRSVAAKKAWKKRHVEATA